jgi:hypothetical protein
MWDKYIFSASELCFLWIQCILVFTTDPVVQLRWFNSNCCIILWKKMSRSFVIPICYLRKRGTHKDYQSNSEDKILKYMITFIAHPFQVAFEKTKKCSQFMDIFIRCLNYAFYLTHCDVSISIFYTFFNVL